MRNKEPNGIYPLKYLFHLTKPLEGSVQFSLVAQSCPTLCDPMNPSTPGIPVHHQLPWFTQTDVLWVGDVIQPSHPLSSPSPPVPNHSQHQGLFQLESTLPMKWPKYWSFSFRISPSNEYSALISFRINCFALAAKELSKVFSSTIIWKYKFFGAQPSLRSNSHIRTWLVEKP